MICRDSKDKQSATVLLQCYTAFLTMMTPETKSPFWQTNEPNIFSSQTCAFGDDGYHALRGPDSTARNYDRGRPDHSPNQRRAPTLDRPRTRGQPSYVFRLPRLPRPLHRRGLHTAGPPLHHRAPPRADRRREQPSHPTPGDPFARAAHRAVHRPGVRTLPRGPRRVPVQVVPRALGGRLRPLAQGWHLDTWLTRGRHRDTKSYGGTAVDKSSRNHESCRY